MTFLRFALVLVLAATGALSHPDHGPTRLFVASGDAREVYVRMPLPFVFADEIARAMAAGAPLDTQHLRLEQADAGPRYRVSTAALVDHEATFRNRLAGLFVFERDGMAVEVEASGFRLYSRAPGAPFGSVSAARASIAGPSTELGPILAEAVLDIRYELARGDGQLTVQRAVPELAMPRGVDTTNRLITDDRRGASTVLARGQFSKPALFPRVSDTR